MSWDGDHDMPRWVVALFLIALGIMGAYQAITSDGAQGNRSAIEQVADAAFLCWLFTVLSCRRYSNMDYPINFKLTHYQQLPKLAEICEFPHT